MSRWSNSDGGKVAKTSSKHEVKSAKIPRFRQFTPSAVKHRRSANYAHGKSPQNSTNNFCATLTPATFKFGAGNERDGSTQDDVVEEIRRRPHSKTHTELPALVSAVTDCDFEAIDRLVEEAKQLSIESPTEKENMQKQLNQSLVHAVMDRNTNMVIKLIDLGSDTELTNKNFPILSAAVEMNCEDIFSILFDKCDITVSNSCGSLLHTAARSGNPRILQRTLDKNVLDVNMQNEASSATALNLAVQFGHVKCVEVLASSGCDADLPDVHGCTPLHYAAGHGCLRIVEILVEKLGANCAALDHSQHVPWVYANQCFHNLILRYLNRHGGSPKSDKTPGKKTSLHLAAGAGNDVCLEMLIKEGQDILARDDEGNTPLMEAVMKSAMCTTRALLKHGSCGISEKNNNGLTPFHIAVNLPFSAVSEMLMRELAQTGAHLDLVTSEGEHVVHYYFDNPQNDNYKKSILLLELGASIDVVDSDNVTVFDKLKKLLTHVEPVEKINILKVMAMVNFDVEQCEVNLIIDSLGKSEIEVCQYVFYTGLCQTGVLNWLESSEQESLLCSKGEDGRFANQLIKILRQPKCLEAMCRRTILKEMLPNPDHEKSIYKLGLPIKLADHLKPERNIMLNKEYALRILDSVVA